MTLSQKQVQEMCGVTVLTLIISAEGNFPLMILKTVPKDPGRLISFDSGLEIDFIRHAVR